MCLSSPASSSHSEWQLCPSPPEAANTLGSEPGSILACRQASRPTANAALTIRLARRRSAGGSNSGAGNTVGATSNSASPVSSSHACAQLAMPGPSSPTPSTQTQISSTELKITPFSTRSGNSCCPRSRRNWKAHAAKAALLQESGQSQSESVDRASGYPR